MTYTWFILGNGRRGYLERTIASWEANLIDAPKYRYIFDDSGNPQYIRWLQQKYGDRFSIVPVSNGSAGHVAAINKIFSTLSEVDTEYFLGIEEDWMLFRPLSVKDIMNELSKNKDTLQIRIPRTVWHSDYHKLDLYGGSILRHQIKNLKNESVEFINGKNPWYKIRSSFYFWSHNPSVFHKNILNESYDDTKTHEYDFGIKLLSKYPNASIGFWAANVYDGYITHIGFRDPRVLKSIPELGDD